VCISRLLLFDAGLVGTSWSESLSLPPPCTGNFGPNGTKVDSAIYTSGGGNASTQVIFTAANCYLSRPHVEVIWDGASTVRIATPAAETTPLSRRLRATPWSELALAWPGSLLLTARGLCLRLRPMARQSSVGSLARALSMQAQTVETWSRSTVASFQRSVSSVP